MHSGGTETEHPGRVPEERGQVSRAEEERLGRRKQLHEGTDHLQASGTSWGVLSTQTKHQQTNNLRTKTKQTRTHTQTAIKQKMQHILPFLDIKECQFSFYVLLS